MARLLLRFETVHFRDFMALQLTPLVGMTACADRMGDSFPELHAAGRMVQGYDVSGPLSQEVADAIDHDLADPTWRSMFDTALRTDRRLQRGLFEAHHVLPLQDHRLQIASYSVKYVKSLCARPIADESELEYGIALVKTAAALVYTYRLALAHDLQAATDSAHFRIFERSCLREHLSIGNHLLVRQRY